MKKLTAMCMAFTAALFWFGTSLADPPDNGWLSATEVTQKLDAQGFKHVQALQAVHGHWEGEAFQNGQLVKFHADAKTGQVTFEKAKDNARGNN
jgi:hypothetical protein